MLRLASFHAKNMFDAVSKSQAIIEFTLGGTVTAANRNFCEALGYEVHEIIGKHHRIFVDPIEAATSAYQEFWAKLARGEFDRRQYKRITKDRREIWIEASYNPVFRRGKPYKVVKLATEITRQKLSAAEDAGKLSALSRAQAVIEFSPAGEILTANENFLNTLGYDLSEIVGKRHAIFCEPDYATSGEYQEFWERLGAGEFFASEYLRIGKAGRRVSIQASYNPIFDMNGKVFKVVKFATDVSERVGNVELLAGALRALSKGDLTQDIRSPFLPALEPLRIDFNETSLKLRTTMQTIIQNAGAIAAASQQIQAASNDLAKRTEQQAASVEETAASLEQITTTVADSSHRAQEAGEMMRRTKDQAERSGDVVRRAIEAMDRIEQSSDEIANIIGIIDSIAFQTNLLALNAGVEAARAGDAGKGFAVVAQEVRELAQRSANAAKDIKGLILNSNQHVKAGVCLVSDTGAQLQEIVGAVTEVNVNVETIVEASNEQATGLKEINRAVTTIDQGTQQNAAMVEETSAAAHALSREAGQLFALIGQFQTGEQNLAPLSGAGGSAYLQWPSEAGAQVIARRSSSHPAALALREKDGRAYG
ncbi:PAS domain-containing protein [Agrobacterium tumefaciens]|uniref:methyl-accepting chemotaxis protein n=1 Tax=Agrobacterium tumefaciens TaxID=358 RepID=UPI0015746168|nr:PAS domain-containing methyl-accepting chemotaxis protein [Agrobacterium tumefaciens]NTE56433.1 PAS domain-containing protein [Agrobacterium tumefaciens]NTE74401.1 PAS domain-containing protein [Agrobacterium tumefaciens]